MNQLKKRQRSHCESGVIGMSILAEINYKMNRPSERLIETVRKIDGDIMILGISGKIGYNLSALLMNALKEAGIHKKVYGVARFSDGYKSREKIEDLGIETIQADFMKDEELSRLPKVKNILYMVGYKFGTTGNEAYTWAVNSYLPGRVAEIFKESHIVAYSTGCVYPLVDIRKAAPSEEDAPLAVGEYAQSCLGRERIFEHFSKINGTPIAIYRLNYAIDVRYGVLVELAKTILEKRPIDLAMGAVNVIWQPDSCEMAIESLLHTSSPANIINITGPETLSVRWLATRIGEKLGMEPIFEGEESDVALLSNASKSHQLFGYPKTSIREMIDLICMYLMNGGETDEKLTHFQEMEGKY